MDVLIQEMMDEAELQSFEMQNKTTEETYRKTTIFHLDLVAVCLIRQIVTD